MDSEVIVSLKNVNKYYGTKENPIHILKNISFDVKKGEVVCLIGPSGSGKSTCLRTINALESIPSGQICVAGISYDTTKESLYKIRRNTGMVFQKFELFSHMTALENVMLGPTRVLNKTKSESEKIAKDLLDMVGLSAHWNKYPKSLSGGQQQRVAIARALANSPQVLLCDEPTSSLDPELVDDVIQILMKIAKSGMTMIIVTHELDFVQKVSHRTLFLDEGTITEQGQTKDLFQNPKTDRLKQFISKITHKNIF